MKACSVCKLVKPFSEFGRRAAMRDGHTSQCKLCNRAQQKAFAEKHPDRVAARQRRHYEKNRERLIASAKARAKARSAEVLQVSRERRWIRDWMTALVTHAKHAAKAKGREFAITRDDVAGLYERQKGRCYWLNIPFVFEMEPKHPQRPSIDRIDPSKGYTPDNVVLSCLFANLGRNSLSAERFADFVSVTGLRKNRSSAA